MTDAALPSAAGLAPRHVVDVLIEERAEKLMTNPLLWRAIKAVIYPVLRYRKAVEVANALGPLTGLQAMDWVTRFLNMTHEATGVEHVPQTGPVVIIGNHPGGLTDSVSVWNALKNRRPDICYFGNRDGLRVCPGFAELMIPVEWRVEHRTRAKTRETLIKTKEAFDEGRCIVVFPAGRMAQWSWAKLGLVERPWMPTAVSIARKNKAPIVPLGVDQHMSMIYYAFAQMSEELRNMTVFYEFLVKRGAHYKLKFGPVIDPLTLPADETEATEHMRLVCEALAWEAE
jgi:putative hemolysin